jgi:YHS domain-containing protein
MQGACIMFGLFKKKDPICGMKEEKGKGELKHGQWFCSGNCLKQFEQRLKKKPGGCCGR